MADIYSSDFLSSFGTHQVKIIADFSSRAALPIGCVNCQSSGSPFSYSSTNTIKYQFELPTNAKLIACRAEVRLLGWDKYVCDAALVGKPQSVTIAINSRDATAALGGPFSGDNTIIQQIYRSSGITQFLQQGTNTITIDCAKSCSSQTIRAGLVLMVLNPYYVVTGQI